MPGYFYEQDGTLQAGVKTDFSEKEPNYKEPNYSNVPILLANDINLSELTLFPKRLQQSCIHLEQSSTRRPSRVVVIRGGLKAGMNGESEHSKVEKSKPEIIQTDLPQLPIEIWEYILSYLSIDDIQQASYTCRLFKGILTINLINRWMIEEKIFMD